MIDQIRFPHNTISSRGIDPVHKDPINQGMDGTKLGTHPKFSNDTIVAEGISLILQAAENSILATSVLFGNINII